MLFRHYLLSIVAFISIFSATPSLKAQTLLPYTPELNGEFLDSYGAQLLQDAVQLMRFREFDLALSRAKLSVQLSPNQYEPWFVLGTLQIQAGETEAGVKALQEAKRLAPEDSSVLFSLGNSYFQLGDYDSAVKELQAGLKINKEVPQAYFDLGNAYFKLTKYSEAISSYQKAVKLEKEFWPAINNIGLVEYEKGQNNKAVESWRKALSIDKNQAEPMLAVAVALYNQGKKAEAIQLGKEALKIDNSYGDVEFLKENLWGEKLLADTAKFFQNPDIQPLVGKKSPSSQE
ncbi:tetratricopeptide repeat protein [Geminocystis sp. NIES-3708]|uniref:tetratricopeptide repeat protein n=1 Tax=Geminocystis sp. NIES-3708 TaxID=1615909 RepID=UPI0009E78CC9|nr:tetratricopeptide repeat protein [Geminocystis sp. NIES-3708]